MLRRESSGDRSNGHGAVAGVLALVISNSRPGVYVGPASQALLYRSGISYCTRPENSSRGPMNEP